MPKLTPFTVWATYAFVVASIIPLPESRSQNIATEVTEFKDLPEHLQRYHRIVSSFENVYELSLDGLIFCNIEHRQIYHTPLPLLEILSHPKIASDLGILATQKKQLENQIHKIKEACKQVDVVYKNVKGDKQIADSLLILEPAIEEAIGVIRDVLVEFQASRFRQILLQLEVSRRGILWLIESPYGDELGLSATQTKNIKARYLEKYQLALKEVQTFKQQNFDDLFAGIPKRHRDKMIESLGARENMYRTPLCLLAVQLDPQAIDASLEFIVESRWPQYSGVSLPFLFRLNALGEFEFVHPNRSGDMADLSIPDYLMHYCLNNEELGLIAEQKHTIAELRQKYIEFREIQLLAQNEIIAATGSQKITPEFLRVQKDDRQKKKYSIIQAIDDILLPHQKSVLSELAARNRWSQHGPIAYIFNYEKLTVDFTFSGQQKADLQTAAANVRVAAQKKLIELERRLNQEILAELTSEQRKRFDKLTGLWLPLECGNWEFHANLMGRNDGTVGHFTKPIWLADLEVDPQKADSKSIRDSVSK